MWFSPRLNNWSIAFLQVSREISLINYSYFIYLFVCLLFLLLLFFNYQDVASSKVAIIKFCFQFSQGCTKHCKNCFDFLYQYRQIDRQIETLFMCQERKTSRGAGPLLIGDTYSYNIIDTIIKYIKKSIQYVTNCQLKY